MSIIDSIQLSGVTYQIQGSGGGKAIEGGRGISVTTGETADTVSFNLPISAGTNNLDNITCCGSNTVSGQYAVAFGDGNTSKGGASLTFGRKCSTYNYDNVAGGFGVTTRGNQASSFGQYTKTVNEAEHSVGRYNVSNKANGTFGDSGNTLFSVGNGTADNARHNAFEIRQNGDIYLSSGGTDIKLQDHLGGGSGGGISSAECQTMIDENISGKTDNTTFTAYTATTDERISQDEEVAAAGLNALNDKITPTVELTQAEYDALVTAGTVSADTYYIITDAQAGDLTNYYTKSETNTLLDGKQATLVSGTNIKTVNSQSLLGSGNIDIQGGSTYTAGRGIDITNDTISFSLPISAGTGSNSIVEGNGTTASGDISHAEGVGSNAIGNYSHAEGWYTIANNQSEHASGYYNNSVSASTTFGHSGNTLFSVGNGELIKRNRHNAFEIKQNGDIYIVNTDDTSTSKYDEKPMVRLQDYIGGGSITVDSALSSTSENPVQNKVIYNKIDEVEQVTAAGLNALNDKIGDIETLLSQI